MTIPVLGPSMDERVQAPEGAGLSRPAGRRLRPWHAERHDDWRALEGPWRAMERNGRASVFQTYDWVAPWYRAVSEAGRAEPVIVTLHDRPDAPPAMILPLARHRRGRSTLITFADLRVTDFAGPLMAGPDLFGVDEMELWLTPLIEALPAADILHFSKLIEDVHGWSNPFARLPGVDRFPVSAYYAPFDQPWDDLSVALFSKRRLKDLRAKLRRLNEIGPLRFHVAEDPATAVAYFQSLKALRADRFRILGRDDVLADPMWESFYASVVTGADARPAAAVTRLTLGDEVIGACFGLIHAGAFHLVLPTFKMGPYDKYSPGFVQNYLLMEWVSRQGLTLFDLTIGDEDYKASLGAVERPLYEWMAPLSVKGSMAHAAWRAKVALRRHPRLFNALKRLAGR